MRQIGHVNVLNVDILNVLGVNALIMNVMEVNQALAAGMLASGSHCRRGDPGANVLLADGSSRDGFCHR